MVPVMAVIMAIVPMIISRTILIAWPRIYAEHPIHATHSATDRTADNPANWASGVTTLRRAALHASKNALSVNRDWRGKQTRNNGYSKFLPHRLFSVLCGVPSCSTNPWPSGIVPSPGRPERLCKGPMVLAKFP
jgi:hypothetical protein